MALFGEKVWFRKTGEYGVSSFASRRTQGVGYDQTGAVLCSTKDVAVRGDRWTRQPLHDAWSASNWDGFCCTPWQMVALELKLTKKVTSDRDGSWTSIVKDCN